MLLVFGTSGSNSFFELHKLSNNSPTTVESVTLLATDTRGFIMHSCEYEGGSWLRSNNDEEEHAFYDPGTQQLYKNNGTVSIFKLISVVNSRRGHYVTSIWNPSTND